MATPRTFRPSGFFVFRTPLLPIEALDEGLGLRAPHASSGAGDLAAALAEDREKLLARLRRLVADPVVREALFVASPSLFDAIEAWLADADGARGRGVVDIVQRYLCRMAARPTPFGLFSGCSVGTIGTDTTLRLGPRASYRRHTRLDTHYLWGLCSALGCEPELRRTLRYRPSSGLYEAGGQLRYAEDSWEPTSRSVEYELISVVRTAYLDAALRRAGTGARPSEVAEAILNERPDVRLEDALAYVDQLIDSRILVSELAPPITGLEALPSVISALAETETGAAQARVLESVHSGLRQLDAEGVGVPPSRYRTIARTLDALPTKPDPARLFQVDLYKPAEQAVLGGVVLAELHSAIDILWRVAPRRERSPMDEFREAFRERYGERLHGPLSLASTVPLVEALDDEAGIGFLGSPGAASEPSPLLEGVHFRMRSDPPKVDFGKREAHILRRLGQHLAAGTREWKLSDDDVEVLSDGERAPLPDAFAVVARVSATSAEGISSGDFCVSVNGLSGPSGAMLLGRFCHGDDELRRRVEEHLRSEEAARPEAIFAEVVHLAEGRLGNILCRPSLRSYDIPYLGRSGLPEARQIPVADLRIGLKNGQLSLFSARHLREVVPRLTSAHSFANAALGIYRFLCALRDEGRTHAFGWSWGALAASPFLPRVSRGRVVLAAAQWNLAQDELRALDRQSEESAYRAIQELRRRLALPRWVGLVDGDNVLPVDLDDVLQVTSLVRLVHAREGAVLVEPPGRPVVQGPEGSFVHDLVVPYVCTREAPTVSADAVARHHVAADDVRSTFTPGSEWTYAKLYTGTAGADAVLTQVVAPLLARLGEAGEPLCWFYVRYGDPRWHVRLRVRCRDARQGTAVVPGLLHEAVAPLLADGRIWKVQLDTYEREVNRYGGPGAIETCETIFQADSDACLAIAELLDADSGADARWKLTFRGMHLLLHDFGIEADGRIGVLRQIRAALGREHGLDVHIERQMGAKFRAERPRLEALLSPTWDGEDELEPGLAHLATRSERLAPLVAELSALQRKGRLTGSLSSIVGALLHMHANRLLRSEQRAQELLLYDFLLRLYESQVARARKGGKAARGS